MYRSRGRSHQRHQVVVIDISNTLIITVCVRINYSKNDFNKVLQVDIGMIYGVLFLISL